MILVTGVSSSTSIVSSVNSSPSPVLAPKIVPVEPVECSCVKYAESLIRGIPLLNAIDYPLNTITPAVGDIIKLQYYNATTSRYTYHIAVIKKITEEGYQITQGNKPKCATSTEIIAKDDEYILGFFNQDRQRLIDQLTPIQKQTLWNESGWSHYDTRGSVLTGTSEERGVAQFMKETWKYLTELRRRDNVKPILLDRFDFEDSITMFKYGWEKGVKWYGTPDIVSSTN